MRTCYRPRVLSLSPVHRHILMFWLCLIWFSFLGAVGAAAEAPKLLWTADLGHRIQSSPALGLDGNLYIGTDDGFIHALRPDGAVAWTSRSEAAVVATPTVDQQGNVYFGSLDKLFYSVKPNGLGRWFTSLRAEAASSPAITAAGEIVTGTASGTLICQNAAGNELWRFSVNAPIISSPAVGAEGMIYFGGQDGILYALRRNGQLFWQHNLGERINASPAIGPDGIVYVVALGGKVAAMSPAGSVLWERNLENAVRSSPVLTSKGDVIIGTDDGRLISLKRDGSSRWAVQLPGVEAAIRSTPAITQDGHIIVGSYNGRLHGISALDGRIIWSHDVGAKISASPLIQPNGTIVVGAWNGKVHAYAGASGPATGTWSAFRGNPQRTGRAHLSGTPAELRLSLAPDTRTMSAPSTLEINAEAFGTVETPAFIRLLVNGKQFSRLNAAPFKWTWQETNHGTYHFSAEAGFPTRPALLSSTQTVVLLPASMTADSLKPKLEIKAPASNNRVLIPQLTLSGTAEDNNGLTRVEYRSNDGPWSPANGTTNWTAQIALVAGENNVTVRAVDLAGNLSAEEKRHFRRIVMAPLSLTMTGKGVLKPDLQREELEVGNTYTLMAEPAEGWLFSGWSGSVSNGNSRLTFVMEPGMSLRAEFKPNPFKIIAGDFHGLIFQTNAVSSDYSGYFTLSASERGAFKVRLVLGGVPHELSGQFDADGHAKAVIANGGRQALSIRFTLNWRTTPDLVTGTLFTDQGTAEVLGDRLAFDGREKRSPFSGSYTLSLSLPAEVKRPAGTGYATVQVGDDGRIQMKGRLSDGTIIEQSTFISPEGLWPLYLAPYNGRGLITGWLRFKDETFADLHGNVRWIRPSTSATSSPGQGWQQDLTAIGSRYTEPGRRGRVLNWSEGLLGLQDGGLPELVVFKLQLQDRNSLVLPGIKPDVIQLKLAPETGLITGQFQHPDFEPPVVLEAIVLQKQDHATGFFLTPASSGSVFLAPSSR